MQTSLRWVLLLIGIVIVLGIIWDAKRNNASKRKPNNISHDPDLHDSHFAGEGMQIDDKDCIMDESSAIESAKEQINNIVMLHIMAPRLQPFLGEQLIEAFEEMYLYYGKNQIFHYYENNDGTGKLLFSVVSAIEPGFFDLAEIENFKTSGITLFFVLSRPNHSIAAFESMLRIAKQLAAHLDGEIRDDQRRILTHERIEDYRERIRSHQPTFSMSPLEKVY
jgi:cell division protein ZipA